MILVLVVVIFISLFILYAVSRHDFVLLRQSISLRQVFDNAFIAFIVFFLFSRIGYAIFTQSYDFLHPLKFLYISKYWGIIPFTGFIGMTFILLFLFRKKKNKLRILDIYFISLTPLILLDVLMHANNSITMLITIIATIVLAGFYGWFIKIHNKYTTKDGFIAFMTIITYSLVSIALSFATGGIFSEKYLWFNILLGIVIFVSTAFLILIQRGFFGEK